MVTVIWISFSTPHPPVQLDFCAAKRWQSKFSTEVPIAALTNIGHAQPVDYNHDGKMDYILYGEEDMSLLISQPDATYDQLYLSIYYYFWAQYGNLDKLNSNSKPSLPPPSSFVSY